MLREITSSGVIAASNRKIGDKRARTCKNCALECIVNSIDKEIAQLEEYKQQIKTLKEKMMSKLLEHAKNELRLLGMTEDSADEMNAAMTKDILQLIEIFSEQGHSGFSANYCISMFEKLARYETLGPITGEDDEWVDVGHYESRTIYQNKRASNVFKEVDENGTTMAYQMDRYVFREPNGACFTRGGEDGSRFYITEWPYTPEHEYIDVQIEEQTN